MEKIVTGNQKAYYVLDRRIWLNKDKTTYCEEGSEDARFLLGTPGTRVPEDFAKEIGLVTSEKKKAAPKSVNKSKGKGKDKSKDKGKGK